MMNLTFFLYWSIIVLPCYVSLCCTKCISYMYTYIPSLVDLPPTPAPQSCSSRSSQSTRLGSVCHTSDSHLSFTFLSALPEHTFLKKTEKEILTCFIVFGSLSNNDYSKKLDLATHRPLCACFCTCL